MDILEFKDIKPAPDIIHEYTDNLKSDSVPIIIDNGSYQCRVGWLINKNPLLIFRNLIAKPRKERSKKDTVEPVQTPQLQVGNDIINIEAMRFQLKTQFDRNVVTHFEAQEHLFDYSFTHLGIVSEQNIPHPIVLTEPLVNPNSSRQLMSELLFECYGIPSLAYGVDALYSYLYSSKQPQEDALIVSLGNHTMHVIPVLKKETIFHKIRRINNGGSHVISFLHRILQLKYPAHATAITLSRAEELLHTVCKVASDYKEELEKWTSHEYYERNTKRIQLPYNSASTSALTLEQQKERKRELAKRLSEINARKREERLMEDEVKLQNLLEIQDAIFLEEDEENVVTILSENNLKSVDDLNKTITALHAKVEKTKEKMEKIALADDFPTDEPPSKQPKNSKIVFENEKAQHTFIQNIKKMKQDIVNRKAARKQRRQDMAKRRTAAGQERMRIISQLARKEKGNDDFGLRDEDWDIYKTISREAGDSDSEAENEKLIELDDIIKSYDPTEADDVLNPGELHQLHVGIERYRAPELIFKPYMIGSSEAGLTEVIGYVLSLFTPEEQLRLAKNVVLTGGLANLPGLKERIYAELVSIRPFQSYSNVQVMDNCNLSSWHGARRWALLPTSSKYFVTRKEYQEYGGEYFKSFNASNVYTATPNGQLIDVCD